MAAQLPHQRHRALSRCLNMLSLISSIRPTNQSTCQLWRPLSRTYSLRSRSTFAKLINSNNTASIDKTNDVTDAPLLSQFRVVLVAPKHSANVGACARALANFEVSARSYNSCSHGASTKSSHHVVACGNLNQHPPPPAVPQPVGCGTEVGWRAALNAQSARQSKCPLHPPVLRPMQS